MIPQNQGRNWGNDVAALLEVQKASEDVYKQNMGTDEILSLFPGIVEANVVVVSQDSQSCGYVSSVSSLRVSQDMMRQVLLIALMCKSLTIAHGARTRSEGKKPE